MRHAIGWQIQAEAEVIYGVDIQLSDPLPLRVRLVEFSHEVEGVKRLSELDIVAATEQPSVLKVQDLMRLILLRLLDAAPKRDRDQVRAQLNAHDLEGWEGLVGFLDQPDDRLDPGGVGAVLVLLEAGGRSRRPDDQALQVLHLGKGREV